MPSAPLLDDDDAGDDRGHEGQAGKGQGHVDAAAALLPLHTADGVALGTGGDHVWICRIVLHSVTMNIINA